MQTFIAILRGINVGGHKKVPMRELKEMCDSLGFRNVITYIQSGNVVFRSAKELTGELLSEKISEAILIKFGFEVPVICRTMDEWNEPIENNPFLSLPGINSSFLYVTFLEKVPAENLVAAFTNIDFSPEKFFIRGKDVYLYCPDGYGNAQLNNTFIENRLGVMATTRNWKTVVTLGELAANR